MWMLGRLRRVGGLGMLAFVLYGSSTATIALDRARISSSHAGQLADATPDGVPVVIVGHNSGRSVASAEEALAAGADVVEIDVRSLDGVLISSHVSVLSIAGVAMFVGPSVDEIWAASAGADAVLLDLKESSDDFIQLVSAFLIAHRGEKALFVASPDAAVLAALASDDAETRLLLSVHDRRTLAGLVARGSTCTGIDGVTARHELLDDASVRRLHAAGFLVYAWTVNDVVRAKELIHLGVDGVITDSVVVVAYLDQPETSSVGPLDNAPPADVTVSRCA